MMLSFRKQQKKSISATQSTWLFRLLLREGLAHRVKAESAWKTAGLCLLLHQQSHGEEERHGEKVQKVSMWGREAGRQSPTGGCGYVGSSRSWSRTWSRTWSRNWSRTWSNTWSTAAGGPGGELHGAVGCAGGVHHFHPSKNAAQYRQKQKKCSHTDLHFVVLSDLQSKTQTPKIRALISHSSLYCGEKWGFVLVLVCPPSLKISALWPFFTFIVHDKMF